TVAGDLLASTASGDHANISTSGLNSTKTVNRTWTVTNSGITFNSSGNTAIVTLNWVAGDVDGPANTANFKVAKFDAPSTWAILTSSNQTATSIQGAGVTSFSDFQVG